VRIPNRSASDVGFWETTVWHMLFESSQSLALLHSLLDIFDVYRTRVFHNAVVMSLVLPWMLNH